MARNGTGTYVLPAGNPVVAGTTIDSTWANPTLSDIASALTGSLPRDGQAGMTGPFKLADGNASFPAFGFNGDASTGLFRPAAGTIGISVLAGEKLRINSAGNVMIGSTSDFGEKLQVTGTTRLNGATSLLSTLAVTGATTLSSTLGVTGATTLSSTLNVTGLSTLSTLNVTGATAFSGALNVVGNLSVDTNKFVVLAASGNTTVGGTMNVAGATAIAGQLTATGNFAVNVNKFNVTAATGNTAIAGTLGVAGLTTISNVLQVTDNLNVGAGNFVVTASNGSAALTGTLTVGSAATMSSTLAVTGEVTAPSFNATSTGKLKKNQKKLPASYLVDFNKLTPKQFVWKKGAYKAGLTDFGFIAEEVAMIYPEAVGKDVQGNATGIDYGKLTTILTAKIQELEARLQTLEGK